MEDLIWLLKTPEVFSMKPMQIEVMPWYKLLLSWVEMSSEVWPWGLTWAAQFASPWWHFHTDLGTEQEKMFLWSVGAGCFYSPDSRAIRPRENGCSSHGGLQVCSWESSPWSTKRYRTQIQPQMLKEGLCCSWGYRSRRWKRFLFSPHLALSSLCCSRICLENTSFLGGKRSVPCSAHRTLISWRTRPASVF